MVFNDRERVLRGWLLAVCVLLGCSESPTEQLDPEWSPDGMSVVWHHYDARLADRPEWGEGGRDPEAGFLGADGLSRFELMLELHSGSPEQTNAPWDSWDWPLYFGVGGGPFGDTATVHMYECAPDGSVYEGDGYYAFCRPGTAIFFLAFPALEPVPLAGEPTLPAAVDGWWRDEISFARGSESERWRDLAIVTKYAFYGQSEAGYAVPVTFHPHAVEPPGAQERSERWRVAYFDDREQ